MQRAARAATLLTVAIAAVLSGGTVLRAEPVPDARPSSSPSGKPPVTGDIRIQLAGETVTVTLEAGEAARAFRALLPLKLTLKDHNGTEKIGDLPKRLPVQGEPAGADPEPGDIAYYAPWGNLAIYYADFEYSRGLVRLGRLSRIPDAFRQAGPVTVTIEVVR